MKVQHNFLVENENLAYLSMKRKQEVKKGQKLQHTLSVTSKNDLKTITDMNLIQNIKVGKKHVYLAY